MCVHTRPRDCCDVSKPRALWIRANLAVTLHGAGSRCVFLWPHPLAAVTLSKQRHEPNKSTMSLIVPDYLQTSLRPTAGSRDQTDRSRQNERRAHRDQNTDMSTRTPIINSIPVFTTPLLRVCHPDHENADMQIVQSCTRAHSARSCVENIPCNIKHQQQQQSDLKRLLLSCACSFARVRRAGCVSTSAP